MIILNNMKKNHKKNKNIKLFKLKYFKFDGIFF